MTIRIYQPTTLSENQEIILDDRAYHHLRVLRVTLHDSVHLFNGKGGEYQAAIIHIDKKNIRVRIQKFLNRDVESPLILTLAQGISRGEKMDFTIQKAVELGVKKIIPLLTERCNVKLNNERQEKKLAHWQSVVISACEQCGRNTVPEVSESLTLSDWLSNVSEVTRFVLSPVAEKKLPEYVVDSAQSMALLIGPEGGLSEKEIMQATRCGFHPLRLGPRILRTETAGVAGIVALQTHYGDM